MTLNGVRDSWFRILIQEVRKYEIFWEPNICILFLSSVDIGMIVRTILKPCISLCQLFLSLCSWTNIICIKASTNTTIFIYFVSDPTTCNLWENQWTVRLPKHLIPFWNSKKYNQPPLPNIYYDTSLKINQTFSSQKQAFGNKNIKKFSVKK